MQPSRNNPTLQCRILAAEASAVIDTITVGTVTSRIDCTTSAREVIAAIRAGQTDRRTTPEEAAQFLGGQDDRPGAIRLLLASVLPRIREQAKEKIAGRVTA